MYDRSHSDGIQAAREPRGAIAFNKKRRFDELGDRHFFHDRIGMSDAGLDLRIHVVAPKPIKYELDNGVAIHGNLDDDVEVVR